MTNDVLVLKNWNCTIANFKSIAGIITIGISFLFKVKFTTDRTILQFRMTEQIRIQVKT